MVQHLLTRRIDEAPFKHRRQTSPISYTLQLPIFGVRSLLTSIEHGIVVWGRLRVKIGVSSILLLLVQLAQINTFVNGFNFRNSLYFPNSERYAPNILLLTYKPLSCTCTCTHLMHPVSGQLERVGAPWQKLHWLCRGVMMTQIGSWSIKFTTTAPLLYRIRTVELVVDICVYVVFRRLHFVYPISLSLS